MTSGFLLVKPRKAKELLLKLIEVRVTLFVSYIDHVRIDTRNHPGVW